MRGGPKKVRILRALIRDQPGHLGKLAQALGEVGANIGDITKLRIAGEFTVRDFEIYFDEDAQLERLRQIVATIDGITIESVRDPVLDVHRHGKIRMRSTVSVERIGDMRMIYTPGVATVANEIFAHPEKVWDYTALGRTVAIVTNGTAVLGLGNIGVHAGLPVMEGKAVLLDRFAGLSGIPILIPTRDPRTFVDTVTQIAPSFGAIQLEDIAAPECFEIERRLVETLPIPVMHDDQHGTAVVVLAALLNATRLSGIALDDLVVGVVGLGAAGLGISRLLLSYGVKGVVGSDINQDAMRAPGVDGRRGRRPGAGHGRGPGGDRHHREARFDHSKSGASWTSHPRAFESGPRDRAAARARRGGCARRGRPLGEQRARLPGTVPRRARGARAPLHRPDEDRGGEGDRAVRRGRRARAQRPPPGRAPRRGGSRGRGGDRLGREPRARNGERVNARQLGWIVLAAIIAAAPAEGPKNPKPAPIPKTKTETAPKRTAEKPPELLLEIDSPTNGAVIGDPTGIGLRRRARRSRSSASTRPSTSCS